MMRKYHVYTRDGRTIPVQSSEDPQWIWDQNAREVMIIFGYRSRTSFLASQIVGVVEVSEAEPTSDEKAIADEKEIT